jgi:Protein of unknown function (DUF3285)
MSQSSELTPQQDVMPPEAASSATSRPAVQPASPAPSYVKLAMRNMVRKGGKSLFHFGLTTAGLLGLLLGLAYLTR